MLNQQKSAPALAFIPSSLLWVILIITLSIAFFYGIANYGVMDVNEGLYAEIAHEMFKNNNLFNYLIPHLNYVPYIEKPPMLYWLISGSYALFGVSSFAAHLVPSVFASLTSLLLAGFGYLTNRAKAGLLSAIIFASSFGIVVIAHTLLFDMVLTFFLTFSLLLFYLWYQKENNLYLQAAYALLALAFLTKGLLPIGLAFSTAIIFLLTKRTPFKKFLSFFDWMGIVIFLGISLAWLVPAAQMQPNFLNDFFLNEQIYRFFNLRIPHDYHIGPIYFYLPRILAYLFPWCLLIPALFYPFKILKKTDSIQWFCWLWFLIPFVLFSLSSDKGDYYMLLGMPPLAYLLGLRIEKMIENKNNGALTLALTIAIAILLAGTGYILYADTLPSNMETTLFTVIIFLAVYAAAFYYLDIRFRNTFVTYLFIIGLIIPGTLFYVNFRQHTQYRYTQIDLARYILKHDSTRPIYLYQNYEKFSSLGFYLNRPLPIIDTQSKDLYYGYKTGQAKPMFVTFETFAKTANKKPTYVILLKSKLKDFQNLPLDVEFVPETQSEDVVLLSNTKTVIEKKQSKPHN